MSIKTAIVNGVASIEIARPEKKNALTRVMYQAMADALPHAQLLVVPDGGHASNLTHPAPVNAALQLFLDSL